MNLRPFERFDVQDKPLGRLVRHDERSRLYPAPMASSVKSVVHVRLVPIFNQRKLGSCTGNACAGALSTAPFKNHFTETDAVRIYSEGTKLDSIFGTYPPTDTGSSGLAVMHAAKNEGLISGYTHSFSFDHFLKALVLGPCIVGMAWRTGGDSPNADGLISYTGAVRGGHEVLAREINAQEGLVGFDNSWGEGYGDKGRFFMSYSDVKKALADSGDATFPALPS